MIISSGPEGPTSTSDHRSGTLSDLLDSLRPRGADRLMMRQIEGWIKKTVGEGTPPEDFGRWPEYLLFCKQG